MAFAFVLATALGLSGWAQPGSIALGASTTLTIMRGDVEVSSDGTTFAAAGDGDVVRAGTTIRTSAGASAVVTYFDGSTVVVDPNTSFTVASIGDTGPRQIWGVQSIGRTWHVVQKTLSGGRYEVTTPTLTASVRGTVFVVTVGVDERGRITSTLDTLEGAVAVSWPGSRGLPSDEVIVTAGRRASATTGAPIDPVRPTPRVDQGSGVSPAPVLDEAKAVLAKAARVRDEAARHDDGRHGDDGHGPGGPGGFLPLGLLRQLPRLPLERRQHDPGRVDADLVEREPRTPHGRGTAQDSEPARERSNAPSSFGGFLPSAPLPEIPTLSGPGSPAAQRPGNAQGTDRDPRSGNGGSDKGGRETAPSGRGK